MSEAAKQAIISIHVPREGDDGLKWPPTTVFQISIHVPREGDDVLGPGVCKGGFISIHVPREGDDRVIAPPRPLRGAFQSTSPVRGTTPVTDASPVATTNFNPRPP